MQIARTILYDLNQLLRFGNCSSRFSGTCRNKAVVVERIKKAHVDQAVLAHLLQLKHVNVTKVFHTEEDIEFR